ncbi:MAG TPA: glycosyl hydrolase family 28-related protein, partial [Polyangia bacterium]
PGVPITEIGPKGAGNCPTAPATDLPDWSKAGYRGGQPLPDTARATNIVDATKFGVTGNDATDDSKGLQAAIDSLPATGRSHDNLAVIQLPQGEVRISEQIAVDKSFVVIRGQGNDPESPKFTKVVVRPSTNLRWDVLENVDEKGNATASMNGDQPGADLIVQGSGKGGWLWPGRGAFRVQTRAVHMAYQAEHSGAPANRKDIFEGTVNVHWKVGVRVAQAMPFPARFGDTKIPVEATTGLVPGAPCQVLAANSVNMYKATGVANPDFHTGVPFNRMQVFTCTAVEGGSVTLDKPLEFDVPANDRSDGSPSLSGTAIISKVVPLTMVEGVGFEDFYLTYELNGLPKLAGGAVAATREMALNNYGNLAPEYALHGIIFKWAMNSWVRRVQMHMIGSHPIVTEVARHLQIEDNVLVGSWNKGKGGNGYLRGSRVWDSLYQRNKLRELRHFTFQWSASGNVARNNDVDADMNFHGGWERNNLLENNTVKVAFAHQPGRCTAHCGSEGGDPEMGNWVPIWWGAGQKAQKWSGASGPRNVLFRNTMLKQVQEGGPFLPYGFYDASACANRVIQIGWDGQKNAYQHLASNGAPILDWAKNETVDFSMSPNAGSDASRTASGMSLSGAR